MAVRVSAAHHREQTFNVPLDEGGRWIIALQKLELPPDAGQSPRPGLRPRRPRRPKTPPGKVINNLFTNPYNK